MNYLIYFKILGQFIFGLVLILIFFKNSILKKISIFYLLLIIFILNFNSFNFLKIENNFINDLIFIFCAFLYTFFLKIRIQEVIKDIAKNIENLKTGDLISLENYNAKKNELAYINNLIKDCGKAIKAHVLGIKNDLLILKNTNNKLVDQSLQISNVSSEQAASLEEISVTFDEYFNSSKENKSQIISTSNLIKNTLNSFIKLNESIDQSFVAVKTIDTETKIIKNFTQEINILSLNASIEAANSGNNKGFSAVVKEIKNLAFKCEENTFAITKASQISHLNVENCKNYLKLLNTESEETNSKVINVLNNINKQYESIAQIDIAIHTLNNSLQEFLKIVYEVENLSKIVATKIQSIENSIAHYKIN